METLFSYEVIMKHVQKLSQSFSRSCSSFATTRPPRTKICTRPKESDLTSGLKVKPFHEIPGPKPLPLIGNIWRYLPGIGEFDLTKMHLNAQKLLEEYGPLVREVVVGDRVVVHVFDPRDMEVVFRNEGRYPMRLSHRALLKYRAQRPNDYHSGGLFPSNGEEWHRLRTLFQKPLMHQMSMSVYMKPLQEITMEISELIKQKRSSSTLEMEDFLTELYHWALECAGVLSLNDRLGCLELNLPPDSDQMKLVEAAAETNRIIMVTENGLPFWKIWNTPSFNKLAAAQDHMAKIVNKHLNVAEYQAKSTVPEEEKTVLEKLMSIPNVNRKDVFAMILDIFLAGIDTTAYSTAFLLYHLACNQDVQRRLQEELDALLPTPSSNFEFSQLNKANYLKACFKESMRMKPIAIGTGRILPGDVTLSGYNVPSGTMIITHNQVACQQESNYKDPLKFNPERWLKNSDSASTAHPFCFLPFGYGPRVCVGKRFAETIVSLLVARILRNFNIDYKHEPIDCFTRLINVPDKPLKLTFTDRR